jgi:hypothetical protein
MSTFAILATQIADDIIRSDLSTQINAAIQASVNDVEATDWPPRSGPVGMLVHDLPRGDGWCGRRGGLTRLSRP